METSIFSSKNLNFKRNFYNYFLIDSSRYKGAWKDGEIANNSDGCCWIKIDGKEIKGEVKNGIIYRTIGFSIYESKGGNLTHTYEMEDAELKFHNGMK